VREWPGVPRFAHALINQSGMHPEEVQGARKTQCMPLVLMAAYHPTMDWMVRVARLLGALASLPPSGGSNAVRLFVWFILSTQEPEAAQSFRDVHRH
jgi:hypothetical protein